MDRREIATIFRERLEEVIAQSGLNRSAYATHIGLDRSTLAQLLTPDNVRLPRADTGPGEMRELKRPVSWTDTSFSVLGSLFLHLAVLFNIICQLLIRHAVVMI